MKKMSDKEYFSHPALSNSDFRLLKESPLHLDNKEYFRLESTSLSLGSAVHKLVLEPDEFNDCYVIEEFEGCELNKNSKAYKEARESWLQEAGDREVLSVDQFDKITKMARNVNAIAGGLLSQGKAEHAFFADIDGVPCKCKADSYIEDHGVIIDLKTTKSIADFKKSLIDYNYLTQAAFYSDVVANAGYQAERFIFVLVETTAPYMVSVVELDQISLQEGRALYGEYIAKWKAYKEHGIIDVIKTISAPKWWLEMRGANNE